MMRAITQETISVIKRLARTRRFAIAVVMLLAVGIGTTITVASVVHAVLLRPLPYSEPERLVRIWESNPRLGIVRSAVSRGNFYDWRERAVSFEYIEAFGIPRDALVKFGTGESEIIRQASATERFAEMLGVRPAGGTAERPGLALSHAFWQRRFGGSDSVLGTTYTVEGFADIPVPITSVMPRDFEFPAGADAWSVLSFGRERSVRNVNVLAKIKPGVSIAQATEELNVLESALAKAHPAENAGWQIEAAPLQDTIVGDIRPTLWLVFASVSVVLMIAVINVAGLALARLTQLERERALQLALGASTSGLLRQQLIESLLLAATAGLIGLGIAAAGIQSLGALAPASIPRVREIALTRTILVIDIVTALGSGLILWLISMTGKRLAGFSLLTGSRQTGSRRGRRFRSALLVGQVAFCFTLLVLSVLVVRSFLVLTRADNGFDSHGLLTLQVRHPIHKSGETVKHYPTRRFVRVTNAILDGAREAAGTTDVAAAWYAPMSRVSPPRTDYKVLEGIVAGPLTGAPRITGPGVRQAALQVVTPGFFRALRVPVVAGRDFTQEDRLGDDVIDDRDVPRGAGVAIVSESLLRREREGKEPLGWYLAVPEASYRSLEVVGVVSDVRTAPELPPEPTIYLPYDQAPMGDVAIFVRTVSDPSAESAVIRATVRNLGSDVAAYNLRLMDDVVATALARPRFNSAVMIAFGIVGILFTAAGLYTLLSFLVIQRTRELAVRMAVGARPIDLMRLIVGHGLGLTVAGIAIGSGAAFTVGRVARWLMPEVSRAGDWSFVAVAALLLLVAALASYAPARRATQIDPMAAMRAE